MDTSVERAAKQLAFLRAMNHRGRSQLNAEMAICIRDEIVAGNFIPSATGLQGVGPTACEEILERFLELYAA
jgi:hypothetical protein